MTTGKEGIIREGHVPEGPGAALPFAVFCRNLREWRYLPCAGGRSKEQEQKPTNPQKYKTHRETRRADQRL